MACQHHTFQHHQLADGFTLPNPGTHYPPDLALVPTHLDATLEVDLDNATLVGHARYTIEARAIAADRLVLDAVDFSDLTVTCDRPADVWTDGRTVQVRLLTPLPVGEHTTLDVAWRVVRPTTGLFFGEVPRPDGGVARFAVTDNETERARYWLPCVDHPSVRPRLRITLVAPPELTALSLGLCTAVRDEGSRRHTTWELDWPVPAYMTCFAVGDFIRLDQGDVDGIEVTAFTTPDHTPEHLERTFGRTPDMLRWLQELLGARYPFGRYAQVALAASGGAMENPSLVRWDDVYLLDDVAQREWGAIIDQINVHEMAHMWFGDAIVCRDFAHVWLKESWATYIEHCWIEHSAGRDEADWDWWLNSRQYMEEADQRYRRPIVTRQFNQSWQMFDAHLYPGGACRLHTLRRELGDDVFWKGVRAYVAEHTGGLVETDDFRRAMERASGRSLVRFFDQWFHAPGFPELKATFAWDATTQQGTFRIEQTQHEAPGDATSRPPVFELRFDVAWSDGGRQHRRTVHMDGPRAVVVVPMETRPEHVRIDPDHATLHRLTFDPGEPMLIAQAEHATDVIGRIQAGLTLAGTGRRSAIEAVARLWSKEPFWGVRAEWAGAVARCGSEVAIRALVAMVEGEQDERALAPVLRAAAKVRDTRVLDAVLARLRDGLPHRAAGAGWEAVGAQRAADTFDAACAAAMTPGFSPFAQSGAMVAIAAQRTPEALAFLIDASTSPRSRKRARAAAARAVGLAARLLGEAQRDLAREHLVTLLRDPDDRVREAALVGLESLGDPRALPALDSWMRAVSHQEAVRVQRAIAAIRADADRPTELGTLTRQVDELGARLRTLQDLVDTLQATARATPPEGG